MTEKSPLPLGIQRSFGCTCPEVSNDGEWKSDLEEIILRFQRVRSLVLNSKTLKVNGEIMNKAFLYLKTLPVIDQKLRVF